VSWEFIGGRTLRVNGITIPTNASVAVGEPRAGGYCVQVGSGQYSWAGFIFPLK
jgi:hypothetical protein